MTRFPSLMTALLLLACRGTSAPGDPDNKLPLPTAIGRHSETRDVRWLKGDELGRLARANASKGTLFNIWATWCASCKGEFPIMRELAAQYARRGIHVVPVSVDEPEQFGQLVEWLPSRGFVLPAWVAERPLETFKSAVAASWHGNIPITLLYDAQGTRRYFWDGPIATSEVTPILDEFLSGKVIDGEKHYALSAGVTEPLANPAPQ